MRDLFIEKLPLQITTSLEQPVVMRIDSWLHAKAKLLDTSSADGRLSALNIHRQPVTAATLSLQTVQRKL